MRRVRRVQIFVSDNFHRILEEERNRINSELRKSVGVKKDISILALTELMAKRAAFPRVKLRTINLSEYERKKRRRI